MPVETLTHQDYSGIPDNAWSRLLLHLLMDLLLNTQPGHVPEVLYVTGSDYYWMILPVPGQAK